MTDRVATYNMAAVTLACQASDPETAIATAKSIIMRQGQFTAQIAVRNVEITEVEELHLSQLGVADSSD